ncbi:MAG: carbohydrate ABC transporter permease [Microbacterium sp.]
MTATATMAAQTAAPRLNPRDRRSRRALLTPLVVFLAALSIFPTAFALVTSFTNFKIGSSADIDFVGFSNYADVLSNPRMLGTFGRTFLILIVALPLQLIIGYAIAKVFYQIRDVRGSALIRTLFLLPVMLPEIVVGLLFGYMMNTRIGVIGWIIGEMGLPKPDFFGDPNFVMVSVIVMIVWQWTPLAAIILYGGLLGLPGEIREAAAIDGAGRWRQIVSMELPLLRKVIGLVVLLVGIQLIGTFAVVYVTTQGGPGSSSTVLSYEIYQQGFVFFNTGPASALSILTLLVVIVLSQVLVRAVFKEER